MPDNTERIRQGKAAWARLKQDSRSWNDWILVGYALLEGRAIAIGKPASVKDMGLPSTVGS